MEWLWKIPSGKTRLTGSDLLTSSEMYQMLDPVSFYRVDDTAG